MNPNDFVGLSVIVTPKEDDLFPVFKGTILRVDDPYFKVAMDKAEEEYIYDVELDQMTIIEFGG